MMYGPPFESDTEALYNLRSCGVSCIVGVVHLVHGVEYPAHLLDAVDYLCDEWDYSCVWDTSKMRVQLHTGQKPCDHCGGADEGDGMATVEIVRDQIIFVCVRHYIQYLTERHWNDGRWPTYEQLVAEYNTAHQFDDPLFSFAEPAGLIYHGDNRDLIQSGALRHGAFDFCFADPPFNIGHGYDVYVDDLEPGAFGEMVLQSFALHAQLLRPGGVLCLHVPDSMVHLALTAGQSCNLTRIDWVIWHYRFGQCGDSKFISSKCHCLVFRNGDDYRHTFNPDAVLVQSDRSAVYDDPRTDDSPRNGYRVPLDVWTEFPRLQGNNKEREGMGEHPNQLPELYLARLIKAYTNPGDWLFDGFGSTGTTLVVGRALGRNVVTCDISEAYCNDMAERAKKGTVRDVNV